jgi:hypothetical protein
LNWLNTLQRPPVLLLRGAKQLASINAPAVAIMKSTLTIPLTNESDKLL